MTENNLTRNDLAKLFFGTGVEVGVERGIFAEEILKHATHLYLVDPWKAYKGYREYVSQEKLDGFLTEVENKFMEDQITIVREFSVPASEKFADESMDFVYIDGNHSYENVKADIEAWHKKVKKGGIVAGHDYIKRKGQDHIFGVVPAVNELDENVTIWRGDKSPSWSYIKQ